MRFRAVSREICITVTHAHALWTYSELRQRCHLSSPSCQHSGRRRFPVRLLRLGPAVISLCVCGPRSAEIPVHSRMQAEGLATCPRREPASACSRLTANSFMVTCAMKRKPRCVMAQSSPAASARSSASRPRLFSRVCPSRGRSRRNTWAPIRPAAPWPWPGSAERRAAGLGPAPRFFLLPDKLQPSL